MLTLCLSIFLSDALSLTFACVITPSSTSLLQQEEGHSVHTRIHPQTHKHMCVCTPSHTLLLLLPCLQLEPTPT